MKIKRTIEENVHHFLQGVKAEEHGDSEAVAIIRKYVREGKISDEEEHKLKTQVADSLKIVGIGIPFVMIPGASILVPILLKVAKKHHIDLMPEAFDKGGS